MNSEIKYPYIGKSTHSDNVVLFKADGFGVSINSGSCTYIADWNESAFTNITHEYLSNTWGVVESKEHAEFIIELAELHGAKLIKGYSEGRYFNFYREGSRLLLTFWDKVSSCTFLGEKQITIPLPPKAKEWPEIPKQANCRSAFVDLETWPQAGSKVTTYGQQGNVILPADKNGFYIIDASGLYLAAKITDITKPKSKEDLLIEELQTKLCENNYVDNYTLANDIVNGMIEGLSYEPK